jgi:hypothetical protein
MRKRYRSGLPLYTAEWERQQRPKRIVALYQEGLSLAQVAARLNIPVKRVRARLKNAKVLLREEDRRRRRITEVERIERAASKMAQLLARKAGTPKRRSRRGVPPQLIATGDLATGTVALSRPLAGGTALLPGNLLGGLIRSALERPGPSDIIVLDGQGRPVRRLDGTTRREKPL